MIHRRALTTGLASLVVLPLPRPAFAAPRTIANGPVGSWQVEILRGRPLPPEVRTRLQIEADGRVSAHSGCNGMGGMATILRDRIRFSQMVGTLMACPEPRMRIERDFREALEATRSWRLQRGSLVLLGARNRRLMTLVRE